MTKATSPGSLRWMTRWRSYFPILFKNGCRDYLGKDSAVIRMDGDCHFFRSAAQFRTSVSGCESPSSERLLIRKRWPSGDTRKLFLKSVKVVTGTCVGNSTEGRPASKVVPAVIGTETR